MLPPRIPAKTRIVTCLARDSYKASFATGVTGGGSHPSCIYLFISCFDVLLHHHPKPVRFVALRSMMQKNLVRTCGYCRDGMIWVLGHTVGKGKCMRQRGREEEGKAFQNIAMNYLTLHQEFLGWLHCEPSQMYGHQNRIKALIKSLSCLG